MSVKTMQDLFVATLKDIYYAEKQILKALPGMISKADNAKLKKALETHAKETEGQVVRLEKVFKLLDVPARAKKCDAIDGIIAEAKEHMDEIKDERVLEPASSAPRRPSSTTRSAATERSSNGPMISAIPTQPSC